MSKHYGVHEPVRPCFPIERKLFGVIQQCWPFGLPSLSRCLLMAAVVFSLLATDLLPWRMALGQTARYSLLSVTLLFSLLITRLLPCRMAFGQTARYSSLGVIVLLFIGFPYIAIARFGEYTPRFDLWRHRFANPQWSSSSTSNTDPAPFRERRPLLMSCLMWQPAIARSPRMPERFYLRSVHARPAVGKPWLGSVCLMCS